MPDFPFPLRFKRSLRAKRVRLIVRITGVECVIPSACSEDQAILFIRHHRDWLVSKYREAASRIPALTFWDELSSRRESMLPIQGKDVPLRISDAVSKQPRLTVAENLFQLQLPERYPQHWNTLSERTLFAWARGWLAERAAEWVRHHQSKALLHPRQIRIKRMRTRWGSCGARNDINLNWLLTFMPPDVLEYVVVHELCHLKHRDHSPRFWALVAEHVPGYREQRAWLKINGPSLLYRFGEAGS